MEEIVEAIEAGQGDVLGVEIDAASASAADDCAELDFDEQDETADDATCDLDVIDDLDVGNIDAGGAAPPADMPVADGAMLVDTPPRGTDDPTRSIDDNDDAMQVDDGNDDATCDSSPQFTVDKSDPLCIDTLLKSIGRLGCRGYVKSQPQRDSVVQV